MTKEEQTEFEKTLSKLTARSSFCAVEFADIDKEGLRLSEVLTQAQAYSEIPASNRQFVVRIADRYLMVFSSPWWGKAQTK